MRVAGSATIHMGAGLMRRPSAAVTVAINGALTAVTGGRLGRFTAKGYKQKRCRILFEMGI
jgi:hypothetical protein